MLEIRQMRPLLCRLPTLDTPSINCRGSRITWSLSHPYKVSSRTLLQIIFLNLPSGCSGLSGASLEDADVDTSSATPPTGISRKLSTSMLKASLASKPKPAGVRDPVRGSSVPFVSSRIPREREQCKLREEQCKLREQWKL